MTREEIKVGDIVELNSGGPKMTVDKLGWENEREPPFDWENDRVICFWFKGNKCQEHSFLPETLTACKKEE